MIQSEKLKAHAKRLRLYNIANRMDSILHHAQEEKPTYPEFLSLVLGTEVEMKERKDYERRLVAARLPRKHDLDEYDYNFYEGIDRRQMKELRELVWLREAYNLILMGPSGTGKTFLAAGLVFKNSPCPPTRAPRSNTPPPTCFMPPPSTVWKATVPFPSTSAT